MTGLAATIRETAPQFDTSIAVLVVNLGPYPLQNGTLGVIRSIGRLGIPVFTVQRSSFIPSGASRFCAGRFPWRAGLLDSDQFLEQMARIGKILNRATILVPADDYSAILVAEHADILASWFIFPRQPPTLPRLLASKRRVYELSQQLGIACPQAFFPQS